MKKFDLIVVVLYKILGIVFSLIQWSANHKNNLNHNDNINLESNLSIQNRQNMTQLRI